MKKVSDNDSFSLIGITPNEMEIIKNAFTLLVRQTDNEMANVILNILQSEMEEENLHTSSGKRVSQRRKKIQMRQ